MKYYIFTVEQLHGDNETLVEYATKSDGMNEKAARSAYFDKLSAVNKDLSDNGHTYMAIRMVNSVGGIVEKYDLGEYIPVD